MLTRQLGFSDLHLTTVGLGTWAIGGGHWEWGWGPQQDQQSIDTIHHALALGINWIDSAAAYGLGHAEELIGQAIKERRDDVIIATKCGLVWEEDGDGSVSGRLKADSVRREAEASLRRLNVDVIDLYQIHWPDPEEDIEEAWGTIADLIKEGKVRYGGVSNFNVAQLKRIQSIHPVASLQPEFNMLKPAARDELFTYCQENEIGIVTYSPLRSGILTDKFDHDRIEDLAANDWRRKDPDFQEPRASINVAFVEKLKSIAAAANRPLSQLAIAWVLHHEAVTSAIVGARRPDQIEKSAPAANWRLSDSTFDQIEDLITWRQEALAEAGIRSSSALR
jgi:aryl-alcohol dehydrogenase-like predicted oxidoreductase